MLAGLRSRWTIPSRAPLQRLRELAANSQDVRQRKPLCQSIARGGQLFGERSPSTNSMTSVNAIGHFETVQCGDVGVVQRRKKPGLASRSRAELRLARERCCNTLIATSRPSFVSRAR
jgi:hypothetical protein